MDPNQKQRGTVTKNGEKFGINVSWNFIFSNFSQIRQLLEETSKSEGSNPEGDYRDIVQVRKGCLKVPNSLKQNKVSKFEFCSLSGLSSFICWIYDSAVFIRNITVNTWLTWENVLQIISHMRDDEQHHQNLSQEFDSQQASIQYKYLVNSRLLLKWKSTPCPL